MGTPGSKFQIIQEVLSQEGNLLTVSDYAGLREYPDPDTIIGFIQPMLGRKKRWRI